MKRSKLLLYTLFCVVITFSCVEQKVGPKILKSIYKTQGDRIVGIQTYDKKGRVVFDRTSQIVEDWNYRLMTWITVKKFENEKQILEFYAHSNFGLSITAFEYNKNGELIAKYIKHFGPSNGRNGNSLSEFHQIETSEALIKYVVSTIPDSIPFVKQNNNKTETFENNKTYLDSNNLIVHEYWTMNENTLTHKKVEKIDQNGKVVYVFNQTPYNKGTDEYKYDLDGNLIEELEISGSNDNFQKKEHQYENGKLKKTMFYHDTALAFIYEYFYKDTLLIEELRTRITEDERFQKRRKQEKIEYEYIYY